MRGLPFGGLEPTPNPSPRPASPSLSGTPGMSGPEQVGPTLSGPTGMSGPMSFKHGGVVPRTGMALVHKDERVLSVAERKKSGDTHPMHNVSLHRVLAHLNKGGLHRALGVKEGEPIPAEKLEKAKNSTNDHISKMAHFASTMEGWHHGGDKK